jgi:hypothetical protein
MVIGTAVAWAFTTAENVEWTLVGIRAAVVGTAAALDGVYPTVFADNGGATGTNTEPALTLAGSGGGVVLAGAGELLPEEPQPAVPRIMHAATISSARGKLSKHALSRPLSRTTIARVPHLPLETC